MNLFLLIVLFLLLILVFTVFPLYYLIVIGHAPNWAVAMYIFLIAGLTARTSND